MRRIVNAINPLHNPLESLAMNVADDYFRRDLPSPLSRSALFSLSKLANVFLATEPVGGRVRGRPQAVAGNYRKPYRFKNYRIA